MAMVSTSIGARHIEAGTLRPVFTSRAAVAVRAHFMVYPQQHAARPEVAQFIAWMESHA